MFFYGDLAATYSEPYFFFSRRPLLSFFRRLLMSVLVSRVRKVCRQSMRRIMLLHRYVGGLGIGKGRYRFILFPLRAVPIFKASTVGTWPLVVCQEWKHVSGFIDSSG